MDDKLGSLNMDHDRNENMSCKICSALFENPFQLISHLYEHISEALHKCTKCGERFQKNNEANVGGVTENEKLSHGGKLANRKWREKHTSNGGFMPNSKDTSTDNKEMFSLASNKKFDNAEEDVDSSDGFWQLDDDSEGTIIWDETDDPGLSYEQRPKKEDETFNLVTDTNKIKLEITSEDTLHEQNKMDDSSKKKQKGRSPQGRKKSTPVICKVCGKSYTDRSYLKQHMMSHSGEKPFSCTECGESFKNKKLLRDHKLLHTNEKPYQCTVCGRCFRLNCVLREHMFTHSEKRNFQCVECGKSYKSVWTLNKHKRIHGGKKAHKCEYCPSSFVFPKELRLHTRTHTGEKPYSCDVCHKAFKQTNT